MQYPNPKMPGQPSHCDIDPPAPVIGTPVQEAWAININNVPSPMVGAPMQPWTTERCSCCEDCNSSCCGSGTLCCFLCTSCIYRRNLRMRYNQLSESPCCDCCVDYCCECCSWCQMYRRELQVGTGYHQNMESRGQVNMQPPQGPEYMIR